MDNALTLALNFLELSLFDPTTQSAMTLKEMFLANLLGGVLSEHELKQTLDRFEQTRNALVGPAIAFRYVNDLARILREKQRSDQHTVAMLAIHHASEDMRLLRRIARSQLVDHTHVHIEQVALFQQIQSLYIEPMQGEPAIVLIGAFSEEPGYQHITVSPKNDTYLERRTEIIYNNTSPYPRLHLKLRSRRGAHDIKNERLDWPQKPFAQYDLKVYTFQDRCLGKVQTRVCKLPYPIKGKQISITIPTTADGSVLETTIFDAQEKPLFRCVRLLMARKTLAREV